MSPANPTVLQELKEDRRVFQILSIGSFFLFLWLPLFEMGLDFDRTAPPQENRRSADFPRIESTIAGWEAFPVAFESYFDDHFGFRNFFIRYHNGFKFHVLGVSPNPKKVVLGKQGWLFESTEDLTETMRHANPFSATEVNKYQTNLESNDRWLRERGIPYRVIYVPEAWTLYPENLPEGFSPVHPESRTDQILNRLRDQSEVRFLDLRPLFQAAQETKPLYRTQDPHWNEEGAFLAYLEIMKILKEVFPGMEPLPADRITRREFDAPGGYLNRALSLPKDLMEHHYRIEVASPTVVSRGDPFEGIWKDRPFKRANPVVEIFEKKEGGREELPTLVFFHDSFGNLLLPWLTEHFGQTVSVRYPPFSREIVEWAEPDIVLSLFAERNVTLQKVSSW